MSSNRCRFVLIVACGLALPAVSAVAQESAGYTTYTDWLGWARRRPGARAALASSYDRGGQNADYNWYESPPGFINVPTTVTVGTFAGPGVLVRAWMPHRTANQAFPIRLFFDGEATPRIDTTSDVFFSGGFSYFSAPLTTTCAGGQVCYEPIPFAESLRIESVTQALPLDGTWSSARHYYQFGAFLFPPGTAIASYTGTLSPDQQAARDSAGAILNQAGAHPAGEDPEPVRLDTSARVIGVGEASTLAALSGPGIIRQLNVGMEGATDADLDGLRLRVTYDDESSAAIDAAVSHFFGAGRQRAAYRSLPLGTDSADGFYSYWPMPFRRSVRVELQNPTTQPIAITSARVDYEPGRVSNDLCYLHASETTSVRGGTPADHVLVSAAGRGHYVGNLLYAEQPAYSFYMLEADEIVRVDGTQVLHGTGTEDAYNGGYYYNWVKTVGGEPEGEYPQSAIRPLHGLLYAHREAGVEYSRADQYRWALGDRMPFEQSLDVRMEFEYASVGAVWTSVAFWYQQPPVPGDIDDDGDVDETDRALFVGVLLGQDPVSEHGDRSDLDGNGRVDAEDIAPFSVALAN